MAKSRYQQLFAFFATHKLSHQLRFICTSKLSCWIFRHEQLCQNWLTFTNTILPYHQMLHYLLLYWSLSYNQPSLLILIYKRCWVLICHWIWFTCNHRKTSVHDIWYENIFSLFSQYKKNWFLRSLSWPWI